MNIQFEVGQIVRHNFPGCDDTYEIMGFVLDMLEVRNTKGFCDFEYYTPDAVELIEFTSNVGTYRKGDTVRAMGYEGEWKVLYFTASRLHMDTLAVIENTAGACHAVVAHLVRKVQ